jgi:hypothetical protein
MTHLIIAVIVSLIVIAILVVPIFAEDLEADRQRQDLIRRRDAQLPPPTTISELVDLEEARKRRAK